MQPSYFGPDGRRLFGVFHARSPNSAARSAVLLCNAFGREAIQLHRLLRVLADRLSRAGHDVLRFDYYGTGDSAGEDQDADLDGWGEDILAAHGELTRRAPGTPVSWVGARLGATLAQRTAPRAALARLVMLDPIADGRDYLDRLREQHAQTLNDAQRERLPKAPVSFRLDESQRLTEASGFAIPAVLCEQLRAIRFAAVAMASSVVICDNQTENGRRLVEVCGSGTPPLRVANFSQGEDWTSSLVPPQVVNLLLAETEGRA